MQWLGVTVSSGATPLESMGLGKTNYNGNVLLSICAEHKLVIMNTIFRQSDKYKTTWKHPRSNHWLLFYYIIVRAQDRTDVYMTRTLRGADSWIDHFLVRSIMTLRLLLRSPRIGEEGSTSRLSKIQLPVRTFNITSSRTSLAYLKMPMTLVPLAST